MKLDQDLVDAAIELAQRRFPHGEGGGAALYTSCGSILTSVGLGNPNDCVNLCYETGAMCEAYKRELKITASVCVWRKEARSPFVIFAPCGVCQERFGLWGLELEVAVPHPEDPSRWVAKTLREVNPYYWRIPFLREDGEDLT